MGRAILGRTKLGDGLREMEKSSRRAGADTLRLWEYYKEQALLWRLIALFQMPATALSIFFAFVMFFFAKTIVEVPSVPPPGIYAAEKLPDKVFIEFATSLVNLFATYTPVTAKSQFEQARKFLWDPALSEFERVMLGGEIIRIITDARSQEFIIDDAMTKVERDKMRQSVTVRLYGHKMQILRDGRSSPWSENQYYVKMSVMPRNTDNAWGIVAFDVRLQDEKRDALEQRDLERSGSTRDVRNARQERE